MLLGKDGVRQGLGTVLADLPGAPWDVHTRILEDDVPFLEWKAEAGDARAENGVETFPVRDGQIVVQTVHYAVRPRYDA